MPDAPVSCAHRSAVRYREYHNGGRAAAVGARAEFRGMGHDFSEWTRYSGQSGSVTKSMSRSTAPIRGDSRSRKDSTAL